MKKRKKKSTKIILIADIVLLVALIVTISVYTWVTVGNQTRGERNPGQGVGEPGQTAGNFGQGVGGPGQTAGNPGQGIDNSTQAAGSGETETIAGGEKPGAGQTTGDVEDALGQGPYDESDRGMEEESGFALRPITLMFTGDVLLGSTVRANYDRKGISGILDDELLSYMRGSDITVINNEFPFSTRGEPEKDKQYTFCILPSYVSVLNEMGVDVAGLANNHVLDYGTNALSDTFDVLDEAGILHTGAGNSLEDACRPAVVYIGEPPRQKSLAFIAASRVIPFVSWNVRNRAPGVFSCYDPADLLAEIKEAREAYDYVFVVVHWGIEHTDVLQDYQIRMGHDMIDAGADAVIGMHSHCLQPVEYYGGHPIFYGLGNYVFGENTQRTFAVLLTIEGDKFDYRLIPAYASGGRTAVMGHEQAAEKVYRYLESLSDTILIDGDGGLKKSSAIP